MNPIRKTAGEYTVVARSPRPQELFLGSPGICALEDGSILATMDFFRGPNSKVNLHNQGRVFKSCDGGKTWSLKAEYPFYHARPFQAGKSLYVLGHHDDLKIIRSDDMGETWSKVFTLTQGEYWHAAPTNHIYANGCVYLTMERSMYRDCHAWNVSTLAPVLMRGTLNEDLTDVKNWTFASTLAFRDAVPPEDGNLFGVPFYRTAPTENVEICKEPKIRKCAPVGWLETNTVQFHDPGHIWYDETGHTFHLFMRAHTGGTGYAALLKVVENPDGTMTTTTETVPSGKPIVYLPMPGGQMKFHILYDEVSKLYWLLGTQATDSMIRPEKMPLERYDLPNNERQRLVLHFSKNCVDWCFAGVVDAVDELNQARNYASMDICGEDLLILCRSGDEESLSAHNSNLITFHRVRKFRELIY